MMTTDAPAAVLLATDALREHLVDAHGRSAHELGDLPLDALHHLEHVEHAMGLLQLTHDHLALG